MLLNTMSQMPSYDRTRHTLPRVHVVVPWHQNYTESGMMHAVVTIPSRDLHEAIAVRELARQTPVTVPTSIDTRGWRYSSTWWMQPCGDEVVHAWQAAMSV